MNPAKIPLTFYYGFELPMPDFEKLIKFLDPYCFVHLANIYQLQLCNIGYMQTYIPEIIYERTHLRRYHYFVATSMWADACDPSKFSHDPIFRLIDGDSYKTIGPFSLPVEQLQLLTSTPLIPKEINANVLKALKTLNIYIPTYKWYVSKDDTGLL
jgi:hypothetical protein